MIQSKVYEGTRMNTANVNRNTALTWALLAVLIFAIGATIVIVAFPQPGEPFTELYLLGPGGKASSYPTNLTVNQTANVTVGVVNHENTAVNYTLKVTLANRTINSTSFSLANTQTWENPVSFKPTQRGLGQKLEFDLYKDGDSNVYRSVYLYLTVR
ncbi:MAG: DUF1616 domain-containing protein [Halobacteriota archaeon]